MCPHGVVGFVGKRSLILLLEDTIQFLHWNLEPLHTLFQHAHKQVALGPPEAQFL
jgi:hypothetical protein